MLFPDQARENFRGRCGFVQYNARLNQVCMQALQAAGAGRQHGGRELRQHQALGAQRLLGPRQLVADLRQPQCIQ